MDNKNIRLQYMYLGTSLFSCLCVMTNSYMILCCNIVGLMCLFDCYFINKKEMLLHHILVLDMLHYLNNHLDIRNEIVSAILSTEISTIFLVTNNLLDISSNMIFINKILFFYTFIYYRIYNYSYYLILNKDTHNILYIYSRNNFELCEIYIGIYGLFLLNLYWSCLILKKITDLLLFNFRIYYYNIQKIIFFNILW